MSNENKPAEDEAYDIRIARDGSWWHNGGRIDRPGLVKLFASVLQRDEAGDYWLVTPAERGRIAVEDAPFVAVEMTVSGQGTKQVVRFRTNLDQEIEAGPGHPLVTHSGTAPHLTVRANLEAVLSRSVYYELMELAKPFEGRHGVWSHGRFFPLD